MKVSVIMIAYNIEQYIKKCLDSLSCQTLDDFEVIVVNDGSIDNTSNILTNYTRLGNKLKVINKKNGGPSSARNEGIKRAKGEYIFFIDGDDWIEDTALESMYLIAINNNADIVLNDFFIERANGVVSIYKEKFSQFMNNKELIKSLFLGDIIPSVWSKFYRTQLFIDNNIFFKEELYSGEDLEINTRAFYFCKKIIKSNKPFVHYLIRDDGLTKQMNERKLTIYKSMIEIENFLKKKKLFEEVKGEFQYLMFIHLYYLKIFGNYNKRTHKDIYLKGIKSYVNVKNSIYYKRRVLNSISKFNKFHLYIFEKNYFIGKLILDIRHLRIKLKFIKQKLN